GPEAGAQCGSSARWDLCGGPPVRAVPTATPLLIYTRDLTPPGELQGCQRSSVFAVVANTRCGIRRSGLISPRTFSARRPRITGLLVLAGVTVRCRATVPEPALVPGQEGR
ncbi:MAG: hypothetical protein ABSE77_22430, partial [Acidimicrobiales bacterium]